MARKDRANRGRYRTAIVKWRKNEMFNASKISQACDEMEKAGLEIISINTAHMNATFGMSSFVTTIVGRKRNYDGDVD